MATQKKMEALSFRLPVWASKKLKKQVEYTKWVQMIVLSQLGFCPVCGVKKEEDHGDEPKKV